MRIRKRPQKNAADEAEDGGVRANSERERKRSHRGEADALTQLAKSEANVLKESRHNYLPSLVPQGLHRIDFRRPPRRDKCCESSNSNQQRRQDCEYRNINLHDSKQSA